MDKISQEQRSRLMRRIRSKDTGPEMVVRRQIFALGYRYRLHERRLPGCPDIVFSSRKKVIFVHGCFWHRHAGCKLATMPASRQEYWTPKFLRTMERDRDAIVKLKEIGWQVLIIWECETKDMATMAYRIRHFLDGEASS